MTSNLVVLLAAAACGGATPSSSVRNGTPPASVAPVDESDPIEAQIPGDSVAVFYEASWSEYPVVDCPFGKGEQSASFTAVRPGDVHLMLYPGDFQRSELTKCLLGYLTGADPAAKATDDGDTTAITSRVLAFQLKWHPHFMTLAIPEQGGPPASTAPSPSATQITAFHAMRGAKVAMWSRLPFMKVLTGVDAPELTVLLDAWEMPAEWHRKVSGTITARFASAADARAAAAQIATGHLATITDPALIAAAKGLKIEVSDATLRATVTNFTFDQRELEKQLAPVLEQVR